jgi:uncharacterized protein
VSLLDEALAAIRREQPIARARGVELIGVVGSVARREEGPDSDIDVAYEVFGRASLFDLGGVLMDLKDSLGRDIGMIDMRNVPPDMRARLERDLVRA